MPIFVLCILLISGQALNARTVRAHRKHVSHLSSAHTRHSRHARKSSWKRRGQQKIDAARATEIQQALIREKYMSGEPTGEWDETTQAAMKRYQADHGWQTKMLPDARAIISLGLGPKPDNLLNPTTAEISAYAPAAATTPAPPAPPVAGAPAAGATQSMQLVDQRH